MNKALTVLVVDDNVLLRMGILEALSEEEDLRSAGEAANGAAALEMFRKLKPDVVTMDYRMPGEDGVECSRKIVAEFPDAKIIVLSVYEGEEDIWQAWQAGVRGYLSKSEAAGNVLEAIRVVGAGGTYFPPAIAERLEARKEQENLTARELEVLRLIVDGNSNKEIMASLNISAGTVRLHVSNVLCKLGASDRTQAAITAVKQGIVHLTR
ncbi:response regulator [Pontiella sulfatireligans]|uniref:Transcriptional regulatory protein DegU n=1 Tax=Pontiella sulfatireligans TaxID=2750658 RepID=A0A6C2UST6_9BACT|nr:response regulator transcription factor [Pontiella sulfatireligans]VGO22287.1 Transcriptional regulatory protein DegU [Pontiella sulfatireligans]